MIVILFTILIIYVLFISALIFGFSKITKNEVNALKPKTTFSIVVPFRNEAENLPKLLHSISQLNYPKELFEVILSYITNTLSFLRVGGFILAHAGMMLVVYTLMEMSGSIVGQTAILVLGNLFVMGLEGLIVGIQVLRLEFYEMFSRYYEGNGIAFTAINQ